MDEADRILSCPFCRTRLCIGVNGPFQYYVPPRNGVSNDIVFIPYWRIRGLTYTLQLPEIADRYTDTNLLAVGLKGLPLSLGLRPQAMQLKMAVRDTPGGFIKPADTLHDLPQMDRTAWKTHHDLSIGETVSLIYSPMTVKNDLFYDAVLDKPVAPWSPESQSVYPAAPIDQDIRFLAALCPQCGWDLQGEGDALVMTCMNCHTAWSFEKGLWEPVPFAILYGTADSSYYLPFWRIKAQISGLRADSLADFIRLANLPKVITPALEEKSLFFWSPAFKVNPPLFLRWSKQMTIFQPDGELGNLGNRWPAANLYPASLARQEAIDSIWITLGSVITDKRAFMKGLPDIRITGEDALLVYHPFIVAQRELTHEKMGVVLEKNALKYGAAL